MLQFALMTLRYTGQVQSTWYKNVPGTLDAEVTAQSVVPQVQILYRRLTEFSQHYVAG